MRDAGRSHFGGHDDLVKVRDAADIVRIVGEYVQLKPAGREFKGLCPFHDDHNPSMAVVPHKQIFHCFVCGAGGDAIGFVRKYHKMEFREALEFLAEKLGIQLAPRFGPAPGPDAVSRQDILRAHALAAGFFKTLLSHEEHGRQGRDIISRRAISPAMVDQFLLGVGPGADRWDGLASFVRGKGLPERIFLEAGLLKARDSGGSYDAFRHRLMFPIQDQGGRVIAFGARRIDDADEPKYLNSADSPLFKKRATLYALNHASRAIQLKRTAIITEGYTDTIACHQAGFANAVATLGTALTTDHAAILRRLCETVVLLFDGDEAGQRAADRAVEVFFAESIDVKVATLASATDAKDPDELLKRPGGVQTFERVLGNAVDLLHFRFDRLRSRLSGAGVSAIAKAVDEEIDSLIKLGLKDVSPLRRRLIVKQLARLSSVQESVIEQIIPAGRAAAARWSPKVQPAADQIDRELPSTLHMTTAEHLLGCILCNGTFWMQLLMADQELVAPTAYRLPLVQRLAQIVRDVADDGRMPSLPEVLSETEDLDVHGAAVVLASRVDEVTDRSSRLPDHFLACIRTARLDRDRRALSTASPLDQIELKRKSLSSLGQDRRVLPRPD